MAVNPVSVDPRIVTPLVGCPEYGIERFPRDTLHRVSITLNLFADLIGQSEGADEVALSANQKFALALQLSGLADLTAAVADSLGSRKCSLNPDEIPVTLGEEERARLQVLAARRETSVASVAASLLKERLSSVNLGGAK